MSADSGRHFFKQAGWLVAANLGCGLFMFAVHPIASKMEAAEYGVFLTLLKLFRFFISTFVPNTSAD